MSAAKHTPGPWHADGGAAHILGRSSRAIRTHCANYPTVAYVAGYDDENGEANARLIAAAPELLETLRVTLGKLSSLKASCNCTTYDVWIEVVERVIAKATGAA